MSHERSGSRSSTRAAVLGVLLASALFGTTGTALAQASADVDPLGAGILRLVLGGAGLAVLARTSLTTVRGRGREVLLGAVGVAVYQLGFFWATRRTGVAMASVVTIGVSPLASWLIGTVRGRPQPPRIWFGAAIGILVGLVLLVTGGYDSLSVVPTGVMAAVLAGVAYAAYTESASILVDRGIPTTAVMTSLFLGAGLLTSPALLWTGIDILQSTRGLIVLGYLGLVTLTISYVAFGWSLQHIPPTLVVMLTLLEPVVAALCSVLVLHENLAPLGWVGAAVVGLGMILAGRSARGSTTTVGS